MGNCIDIYSRLIIATITFVVPIIINLLSTFSDGEKRRKELAKTVEDEVGKQAVEEVQVNPEKIKETIDKTSKKYQQLEKKTKNELRLLNPIVQFWNIFSSLGLSFGLLLFDFLIRDNVWGLYNHKLSFSVLVLSGLAYATALFFIVRILYTISRTKKIIGSE
jgi:hypothetical protein